MRIVRKDYKFKHKLNNFRIHAEKYGQFLLEKQGRMNYRITHFKTGLLIKTFSVKRNEVLRIIKRLDKFNWNIINVIDNSKYNKMFRQILNYSESDNENEIQFKTNGFTTEEKHYIKERKFDQFMKKELS